MPSSRSPTLGGINLGLRQDGYAQLQNTFGNLGLVLDLNLLPLRQSAELAAFRFGLASSRVALGETERQIRFDLVNAYCDRQLRRALIPVWEKALEASTALERDAEALRRRGLAARMDVLRREGPEGSTVAHIAAGSATGPDQPGPGRPVGHVALRITAGWWGLSGDRLAAPVLSNGGRLEGSVGSLGLPNVQQSGVAAGSFYNWGAALLLRQPLYDGGRAQSGAAVAERERDLLVADTNLARRRIRDTVSASWSSLQYSDTALNAARAGVVAGERALRDAQLR